MQEARRWKEEGERGKEARRQGGKEAGGRRQELEMTESRGIISGQSDKEAGGDKQIELIKSRNVCTNSQIPNIIFLEIEKFVFPLRHTGPHKGREDNC